MIPYHRNLGALIRSFYYPSFRSLARKRFLAIVNMHVKRELCVSVCVVCVSRNLKPSDKKVWFAYRGSKCLCRWQLSVAVSGSRQADRPSSWQTTKTLFFESSWICFCLQLKSRYICLFIFGESHS